MSFRIAAAWMSRLVFAGLVGASAVSADVAHKVDHTDIDLFDSIPDSYLSQIRQMTIQYTGQSHGRQLPHGLELLAAMDSKYSVQIAYDIGDLTATDALKVGRTYYQYQYNRWFPYSNDDDEYWSTPQARDWTEVSATEAIDAGKPFVVSIWCWCWDLWRDDWVHDEDGSVMTFNDERMSAYLNAISSFNGNSSLDPTVFVYHTAVSDDPKDGESAWKITRYNDQIRAAAAANNGILFDQADIENWNSDNTERRSGTWDGHTVYLRHTDYDEDVGIAFPEGHTNDDLCIRKAKALWVLLAKMSGWDGGGGTTTDPELYLTSPNGGENLAAGDQHTIRWLSQDINAIDILFSSDNGSSWSTVASDISAAGGAYTWTVPATASSQCRIRVTESATGSVTDTSTQAFTITVPQTAIWGDVDDDELVTVTDALKIATYDIDPESTSLSGILAFIAARGDVNADTEINSTDALICASYEVYPDNPYNPARIGNAIGSVPKIAAEPAADALPVLTVMPDGMDNLRVTPAVSASAEGMAIGASTVRITWDPDVFSFVAFDDPTGTTQVNTTDASYGTLLLVRFNTTGEESFAFPELRFHENQQPQDAMFTMQVLNAAAAGTFELLATGQSMVNVPVAVEEETPVMFSLSQNMPNPFNPVTTIRFSLDRPGTVTLDVYNIQGQLVSRLVDGYLPAGQHAVRWDGTDARSGRAASGIYLYQLRAGELIARRQMMLLR